MLGDSAKFNLCLSSGAALGLSLGLALPSLAPLESPSLDVLTSHFGRDWCALWLAVMAVLPIVAIARNSRRWQVISAMVAMFTWLVLIIAVSWHSGILAPAVGAYAVFFVACASAEFQLVRRAKVEQLTS